MPQETLSDQEIKEPPAGRETENARAAQHDERESTDTATWDKSWSRAAQQGSKEKEAGGRTNRDKQSTASGEGTTDPRHQE